MTSPREVVARVGPKAASGIPGRSAWVLPGVRALRLPGRRACGSVPWAGSPTRRFARSAQAGCGASCVPGSRSPRLANARTPRIAAGRSAWLL